MNQFEGPVTKKEQPPVSSAINRGVHHDVAPPKVRLSLSERMLGQKNAEEAAVRVAAMKGGAETPVVVENVVENPQEQLKAKPYNAVLAKRDADERMRKAQEDQREALKIREGLRKNPALPGNNPEASNEKIDMKSSVMFSGRILFPVAMVDGVVLCVSSDAERQRMNRGGMGDAFSVSEMANRNVVRLLPWQLAEGQEEARKYNQSIADTDYVSGRYRKAA